MKVGVLGTGMVGQVIADKLVAEGHEVVMGARSATNEKASAWAAKSGGRNGTFAEAAAHGELIFNCTSGAGSLEALQAAGAENLAGKVLVDIANPLDFSRGMPPSLSVCNTDSLGEQIQRAFPATKVVKALNTMNCNLMVNPALVPGDHSVLMCGDDAGAKAEVKGLLEGWGWKSIVDLGPISASRGTEAWLLLWIRLWGTLGTANFNLALPRG